MFRRILRCLEEASGVSEDSSLSGFILRLMMDFFTACNDSSVYGGSPYKDTSFTAASGLSYGVYTHTHPHMGMGELILGISLGLPGPPTIFNLFHITDGLA